MVAGSNLLQHPHGIFSMSRVGLYWIMGKENSTQHFIHGRGVWFSGERRVNMSTVVTREPPYSAPLPVACWSTVAEQVHVS
jgi:hypothetical protein